MIVDVAAVNVGTDNKCVIAFGKSAGQLTAQAVGFLRRNLAGNKGLPDGVGDHIIRPTLPASLGEILTFGK